MESNKVVPTWLVNETIFAKRTTVKPGTKKRLLTLAIGVSIVQRILLTVVAVSLLNKNHTFMDIVNLFNQWDTGWYISIARDGYTKLADAAFFPMFPMLMRGVHMVFNSTYLVSGLIISWLSVIVGLYVFGLLVSEEFDSRTAVVSVLSLGFFPTAFFFDVAYSESLFLALSMIAVYAAKRRQFWLAGSIAMIATLTRNTGILLDFIIFAEYLGSRQGNLRIWKPDWWSRFNLSVGSLLLPPLGLCGYIIWLKFDTGKYLAFLSAETYWHRTFMPIWDTYGHTLMLIVQPPMSWQRPYYALELVSLSIAIVAIIIGVRYLRESISQLGWWLYLAATTWIISTEPALWPGPLGADYLYSDPRFVLMLFPAFVYVSALVKKRWIVCSMLLIYCGLLLKLSSAFLKGHWVA